MLDQLAGRMQRGKADPKLLEVLGWGESDLRNFVERYRRRLRASKRGPQADARAQRLDPTRSGDAERKRAIELKRGEGVAKAVRSIEGDEPATGRKDQLRELFEAGKQNVSVEYRDLVEAYYQSLVGQDVPR